LSNAQHTRRPGNDDGAGRGGPPVTVSVVIPCYNAEAYVAESVASALAQTHPVREVVCVDDGSTDGTLEVLRRLRDESDGRVTVLAGPNGGPSAARNRGMTAVSGEYVQFLDSDDLLEPDKIGHQIGLIEPDGPRPDLIAAAYKNVFLYMDREEVVDVAQDPWVGLVAGRLGIPSANLYRREAVQRVGGWDEGRLKGEDTDLAFRLLDLRGNVTLDPIPKTTLRRRIDSHWRADLRSSLRGWITVRMEIVARMRERGLLTPERIGPIEQAIFKAIRTVYEYDPDLAAEALEAMLSPGFRPSTEEHGRAYEFFYGNFGFEWAQRLYPYWMQAGRLRASLRGGPSRRGGTAPRKSAPPTPS
jgi:glycosyltransferase involved in cell wall biosynthesis